LGSASLETEASSTTSTSSAELSSNSSSSSTEISPSESSSKNASSVDTLTELPLKNSVSFYLFINYQ
jgi:hypothetical protein